LIPQLDETLQRLPDARYVRKENGGGPSARNYGARIARGRLLLFLDQDLRIPPNFVETHLEVHSHVGPSAVSAHYENRLVETITPFAQWYTSLSQGWGRTFEGKALVPGIFEVHPVMLTSTNVSLPRGIFEAAGGFPIYGRSGAEDHALGLTLARQGHKVFWTDRVCAFHVEERTDLSRFCARQRHGMSGTVDLIHDFPEVFGAIHETTQHHVNGPVQLRRDQAGLVVRKLLKSWLVCRIPQGLAYRSIWALERYRPRTWVLPFAYRLMLGASLQQGWREGLDRVLRNLQSSH
jgi:glycosyltransferase involved in cell wall biosynthesis